MYDAWRPIVPTSVDGEPLAVAVQDLYGQFPYDRVAHGIFGLTLRPQVMVGLVVAYVASKPVLTSLVRAIGFSGKDSKAFQLAVAAHNLGLAIFSGIVMINAWSIVLGHYANFGLEAIYCDRDGSLWGNAGLGAWATIFYLSKYYEFVDTWVLILKVRCISRQASTYVTQVRTAVYALITSIVLKNDPNFFPTGQETILPTNLSSLWHCLDHVGRRGGSCRLDSHCRLAQQFHPHAHVHVLFCQDIVSAVGNQGGQVLDDGPNCTILYRHLLYPATAILANEL